MLIEFLTRLYDAIFLAQFADITRDFHKNLDTFLLLPLGLDFLL